MGKIFCGFDMSLTSSGIAWNDGTDGDIELSAITIVTEPKTHPIDLERYIYIVDSAIKFISSGDNEICMACIEDIFVPRKGKGSPKVLIQLAALGYHMRITLLKMGIPFYIVAASQAKKFTAGKGSAGKPKIIRSVYSRWGFKTKDDNQADAIGMSFLAESLWRFGTKKGIGDLTIPQHDAVLSVFDNMRRYNTSW